MFDLSLLSALKRRLWAGRRAARADSASDERFRLAIESAPYGVVMVDAAGRINLVNRELERAFGYGGGELLGQPVEILLPAELRAQHMLNRKAFAAAPEARAMGVGRELRGRRKDGSEFPIEIGLNPLRGESGGTVLATVVDITQRKAMEKALRDEEQQFRLVVESAPNGVVMVDAQGQIVLVNRALETAFGYSREELLGMPIENLVPKAVRERHSGYRQSYAGSAEARAMGAGRDLRGLRKDGTEFPIEIGLNPLKMADGDFVLATVVDITARKRAEEAHRSSQKMEALGTLAGGIAHDFNNILYAISGNARLAIEDVGPDHPAFASLREIDKAGRRASELVRQILGFARQQESARKPTPLQPVIEEALQLLRSSLPAAIAIRARYVSNLPLVLADSTQIHQIMMNLATNAAHALAGRADAGIDVELRGVHIDEDMRYMAPDLPPGSYVRLSVSDNGSGMSKEVMDRIFDPYFTTKALGEGTGLGLSTVHGIVKAHGGSVSVYSVLGKGTTFHLYFPALGSLDQTEPVSQTPTTRGQGERILYLDDEEPLTFLAERMLGRLGYTVIVHTDPERAMGAFDADPGAIDAVVTDLSMPKMSGFDVARHIRRRRPELPVIITSGYVRPEDQETARKLGLPDLVLKPSTVDELAQALDRALHRTATQRDTKGV